MIVKDSFEVPGPRDNAVAFLLDVERMSACVPGVESVTSLGQDEYEGVLRLQLGPVRSVFGGKARLDTTEVPERLSAAVEGKDRSTGSQVQIRFEADISEQPGPRTLVECTADVTIRGRLGQFGTGMITSTARSVLREFADCAGATLSAADVDPAPAGSAGRPARAPKARMGRVARRSMVLYVKDLWTRLRARVRRSVGTDGRGL